MGHVTVEFDDGTVSIYMLLDMEDGGYEVWMHHFNEEGKLRTVKQSSKMQLLRHFFHATGRLKVAKNLVDWFFDERTPIENTTCTVTSDGVTFSRKDERHSLEKWWER